MLFVRDPDLELICLAAVAATVAASLPSYTRIVL